jgi:putative endonuclease
LNLLGPLYRFADRLRYLRHGNVGVRGEDLAHRYLRACGCIVVARNWRPPQGGGEIDLVAREGDKLVFVEVKTRLSGTRSAPERDIDAEKMTALRRAARDYMRRSGMETAQARFDVLAITGEAVEHLRDAFPVLSI